MSDDPRQRMSDAAHDASTPPNGPDGNQSMFHPDGHLDAETLSAWIDSPDDFSEHDRLAIEAHLTACADCRQLAADLTAIVHAFQTLPLAEPTRSFALTPEMAGLVATPTLPSSRTLEEPATLRERTRERATGNPAEVYESIPWYERQMRALRWATTVAVMLFVFFVSVDVLGNIQIGGDADDDSADDSISAMSEQAPANGADAAPTSMTGAGSSTLADPATAADDSGEAEESLRAMEPTPASADGEDEAVEEAPAEEEAESEPESTGGGALADTPENAETKAPAEDTDTMAVTEPTEAAEPEQERESIAQYNAEEALEESGESDTLHLIELALVMLIAWLIVAMIALPRLRRPSQ